MERKVLRSGTVRNTVQESPPKPERSIKERRKFPKVPFASASLSSVKPKKPNTCQSITQEITTTTLPPKTNVKVASLVPSRQEMAPISARPEKSQLSSPTILSSQQPDEKPKHPAPVPEKLEDSAPAPSTVLPPVSLEILTAAPIPMTTPVSEALPPVASLLPEPKPKSLSLAEYRQLRQQKKPAPVENQDNGNSSKWPSLPELPKELPPIPYLPEPSPKDPRPLTPPATPPHQMWKPIAPVALLGKSKAAEISKSNPSKVIQIEPQPLPTVRSRSKPTFASSATVAPEVACMDHDYCIPSKGIGEPGKRWNVKQLSFITIKPIKPTETTTQTLPAAQFPLTEPLDHRTDGMQRSSVLETPDASPARQESVKEESPRRGPFGRSYRRPEASRTPSPSSSPKERTRGRSRKRKSHRSPSPTSSSSESDSHSTRSQSRSRSPPRKSRSRSRSLSPERQSQWSKSRIRGTMTQKELRERFSLFGEIEDCTLHFRDHGDNYGFVTYYDTKDAFTAIENGSKLRQPDELPFDLCFGGRRQFCQTSYADLDSSREFDPLSARGKFHALDFDTLLKQAQQNLKR
uniref:RRM domain-containing protein n=1 Tax=Mola mola TaxID=94237 RepID=A0A3Q3WNB6_MOLML